MILRNLLVVSAVGIASLGCALPALADGSTTATVTVTVIPPPPLINPPVDGGAGPLTDAAPAPHERVPADDLLNFVRT